MKASLFLEALASAYNHGRSACLSRWWNLAASPRSCISFLGVRRCVHSTKHVTVMKLLRNSENHQTTFQIMMLHRNAILMATNQVGNYTAVTAKQTKQSYLRHHMNGKKGEKIQCDANLL
ncbi:uncharacterized protein LOC110433500 [Sorghum bicolor]|uniref:uncharacterized protein LOC110433500 n=1 Tax=Sorghum bicolor TaxID=4558 RepID=UPI000B426C63|nr:uncharacterized protein LOC110433500 [Sorghum bicolor]XP_021311444.1 uncharacterized protein LOC110433500 [Sorghum bicolor]|eukprot:XP_021311443.1 uncharacterized protein LOC110433500 [Sorghum bicolor]